MAGAQLGRLLGARRVWLLAALLGAATLPAAPSSAQAPSELRAGETVYEIRLADGSVLIARVVEDEGDRLTLETSAGVRVELERAQIVSVRPVDGRAAAGERRMVDPNTTRLFFGPTGRTLPAGEGYVGAFELFFPFVSFGISDVLTIAGGTPIIPEGMGEIFYIAPKVRLLSVSNLDLAVGVLALFAFGDDDSAGILYGAGTWGTPDRAVSVGAGWGFAGDEVSQRPAFMLGGESRVSNRIKLITENYLVTYEEEEVIFDATPEPLRQSRTEAAAVVSAGVRIFGERLSADAGLGAFFGSDESGCCLPLVNFVYSFGGGR